LSRLPATLGTGPTARCLKVLHADHNRLSGLPLSLGGLIALEKLTVNN
jgi:hypothetical protein